MTETRMFPILIDHEGTAGPCPSAIPWECIAPYEKHALNNHGQTLERLAQRGGLSPIEAYMVFIGRRWKGETFNKAFELEACAYIDKIIKDPIRVERDTLRTQLQEKQEKYSDLLQSHHSLCGKIAEMREALEIAKPSTIHVVAGHVYGPDGKLVEFVDGCARCRIEKLLDDGVKRKCECIPGVHKPCPVHGFPALRPVEGPGSANE